MAAGARAGAVGRVMTSAATSAAMTAGRLSRAAPIGR